MLISRTMDNMEESTLYPRGDVPYQFSARGHELIQVLISQLLDRPYDAASVYYRSRPFMLGSGLSIEEAFANGMARAGSVSAGRDVGVVFNMPGRKRATVLPMAGDVGSQFTPAVGWAQAIRYRTEELHEDEPADSIVVVFGGDGAVATNGFWSALTIATTLRLPLLFVIEDNGYAISVEKKLQTPGGNIADNLQSFADLCIWQGSGTKPAETAQLVTDAVSYVRQRMGPGLLRVEVPRLSGHSGHDNQAYKPEDLLASEQEQDPLPILKEYLMPDLLDEAGWEALVAEVEKEVAEARDQALAQPQPDTQEVNRYVWATEGEPAQVGGLTAEGISLPAGNDQPQVTDPRRINLIEAVRKMWG